ncbi:MAG: Sec-independent protein translocase subunit TatA/TatB [Gemmatimonadaceae bacterium]
MNFGNFGFGEILIILLVVLLLFGAKRIPEIAGSFGKGIKEFKKSMNDVNRSITEPEAEERLDRVRAAEQAPGSVSPAPEEVPRPEPKRLLG